MSDTTPVRFGILGAANIARQFIDGVAGSRLVQVGAVASREAEKAAAFASQYQIPRAHGSYQALLADPDIDAVYIPLPNHLHAEWAIRCAEAGKHVLCEKPLTITVREAHAMYDAARAHRVHLVEAYPYMSQPQTLHVRELLSQGAIGRIMLVTAAFGFRLCAPDGTPLGASDNIRLLPQAGGGALLDAGTYGVSFVRLAAGEAPTRVRASMRPTTTGVDLTVVATLEFPSGAIGQVSTSMATAAHRFAVIVGDAGVVETGYSNHAPSGDSTLPLRVKLGVPGTLPFETVELPATNGFLAEAESFARMIRSGPQHWNGITEAESIDIVRIIEAILDSTRTGDWVTLT